MNLKRICCSIALALCCLAATGCFSLEQEVFLNADGSGEFVLSFSLPDLPEDVSSTTPLGGSAKKSSGDQVAEFKKEVTTGLPPTVKIKEVKEFRQNGSMGFYIVFQFKNLKDMEPGLANLGKGSLKEGEVKGNSQWKVSVEKSGKKTLYKASLFLDVSNKDKDKAARTTGPDSNSAGFDSIEKQLVPLLLGMVKLRFVLHAPSPIAETNADIVLHENTAVWNCSLITFMNEKRPVEMRAAF
jgi:hypothetical protein